MNARVLHPLGLGAAAIAAASGVWLLRSYDPNAADSPFMPCLFNALTGLYCPGCGSTRCLHALVHGDVVRALDMNPLLVLMLVAVPLLVAHSRGWRPRWLAPVMRPLASPAFWLVLLPAFTVARNLPWPPFAWMAPG
ncbi:MAG TPA: DUF2752 domain-containing protein [Lysobacter sp.]|nr:DUF2752 domain-containing protein [Lysobacter sp.]